MLDAFETNGSSPPRRVSNYEQAERCLADLRPFKHSTLSAEWEADRYGDGRPAYVVRSYRTVVAVYTPAGDSRRADLWGTETRYSVTTSKHLTKIAAAWRDLLADPEADLYGRWQRVVA